MPKKSETPFSYYTFRYDYPNEEMLQKVVSCVKRLFPKYVLFKEVSDVVKKPHLQGKVGVALSLIHARKKLRLDLPNVFVGTNYSMTQIDDEEAYDSYIAKEGNIVVCNIEKFTEEFIEEQVEKHIGLKTAFESKKQKKLSKSFTLEVADDFVEEFPIESDYLQMRFYKPSDYERELYEKACEKLLNFLIKRMGSVAKIHDDVIIQRLFNGVKNSIVVRNEKCCEQVVKMYKNRIEIYH